jgi:SAM-dependent methyltransferase
MRIARIYRGARSALQVGIDRLLRVRTADRDTGAVVGLPRDGVGNYRASGWWIVWRIIRALQPGSDDVFLDIGSGTGRALYVASRFPFRRVIGVEESPDLVRLAGENLRGARWPGRAEVELVCASVTDYPIPDDVTIVYLYNPVPGPVVEAFARKLVASFDRAPRPIRIAYLNPLYERELLAGASGRIRRRRRLRGSLRLHSEQARSHEAMLFEVVSEATAGDAAGR